MQQLVLPGCSLGVDAGVELPVPTLQIRSLCTGRNWCREEVVNHKGFALGRTVNQFFFPLCKMNLY